MLYRGQSYHQLLPSSVKPTRYHQVNISKINHSSLLTIRSQRGPTYPTGNARRSASIAAPCAAAASRNGAPPQAAPPASVA